MPVGVAFSGGSPRWCSTFRHKMNNARVNLSEDAVADSSFGASRYLLDEKLSGSQPSFPSLSFVGFHVRFLSSLTPK